MTHARAGNPAKALEVFRSGRAVFFQGAYPAPMLALIQQQLGHAAEARRALAISDQYIDNEFRKALEAPLKPEGLNFIETHLLHELIRREVHGVIEGVPCPDSPYRRLLQGRVLARMGRDRQAESAFIAAVAIRPGDPKVRAARAGLLAQLGRQAESP